MTSKGKKRVRGVPVLHDEVKQTHGLKLTDTAWRALEISAKLQTNSRSELVERFARGETRDRLSQLITQLEAIPRNPDKWDKTAKDQIYYGLEQAIKTAVDLHSSLPGLTTVTGDAD